MLTGSIGKFDYSWGDGKMQSTSVGFEASITFD